MELKQEIFATMGGLFHVVRQHLDKQFKNYQLTRPEWLTLALVRLNPNGVSQCYVKNYIGIEHSYFTKILNKLDDRGFITREIDSRDRRNRIIKLHGNPPVETTAIFKILESINQRIDNSLDSAQLGEFKQSLSLIADTVNQLK